MTIAKEVIFRLVCIALGLAGLWAACRVVELI